MRVALDLYDYCESNYAEKKDWQQYYILIADSVLFSFYVVEYSKLIAASFVISAS